MFSIKNARHKLCVISQIPENGKKGSVIMNRSRFFTRSMVVLWVVALSAIMGTAGVEASWFPIPQRSWTCHATASLEGFVGVASYTIPSWGMRGPITDDREQKCKNYLTSNWIDNGTILKYFVLSDEQQNRICKDGVTVRVDYGFDERKKAWNFTRRPNTPCVCPKNCPTDWQADSADLCTKQLCGPVNLSSETFYGDDNRDGVEDHDGLLIKNNYIYQWMPPITDYAHCLLKK